MEYWFDKKGFPIDHPKQLMDALRTIPGATDLPEDRIRSLAIMIELIADGGRDEELPRNRTASKAATEKEIVKLHDLCEKLAAHIAGLHQPAVSALFDEGLLVFPLLGKLKEAQEIARCAYGQFEAPGGAMGRPKKIEAADVTDTVAAIFEEISGKRPTFTTDPATGAVSGNWPQVLERVFAALFVHASVSSQVRALSEKSPSE